MFNRISLLDVFEPLTNGLDPETAERQQTDPAHAGRGDAGAL